jgi:hypothetical protein
MPVRWNPVAVSRAMDEVEGLLAQARPFLALAHEKSEEARLIPGIPEYMQDRIARLAWELSRCMEAPARNIELVRRDLPRKHLQQLQAQPQLPGVNP